MDLPARISTLQRTDRWIGAPLCAILTLLRRSKTQLTFAKPRLKPRAERYKNFVPSIVELPDAP